jgi:hypothetical protein
MVLGSGFGVPGAEFRVLERTQGRVTERLTRPFSLYLLLELLEQAVSSDDFKFVVAHTLEAWLKRFLIAR